MDKKLRVGIIGTGNIGMDLLYKILRSDWLSCSIFVGHNPDSVNIKRAQSMGIQTTYKSIDYIIQKRLSQTPWNLVRKNQHRNYLIYLS